ncbi:MAG: hypothetical protein KTR31_00675 [Myxococcales bacterium]|nr:hypothetical protein [Myxococcales bacterium]
MDVEVTLRGSSPGATTAGIMLLTRARQLGYQLAVHVVGDPDQVVPIPGPAVCYAPVLASCGVGRESGSGATVVVPGPPGAPLMVTVHPHGVSGWFFVDRSGRGHHPATQAFVRLSRDERPQARELGRELRNAMQSLGLSTDPAVLDVLFGADVPPLTRLAVALRAGRALSGGRGEPITRFITGHAELDPLSPEPDPSDLRAVIEPEALDGLLAGVSTSIRDTVERCIGLARDLANDDDGRDLQLAYRLAEIASHLVQLPPHSILPPLGAAEDSVATGLRSGLSAEGMGDANRQLMQVFQFLGGRYVPEASHSFPVCNDPAPKEHIERWQWFCGQVRRGRKDADALWPQIVDPPS